jgi:hypothetical protein
MKAVSVAVRLTLGAMLTVAIGCGGVGQREITTTPIVSRAIARPPAPIPPPPPLQPPPPQQPERSLSGKEIGFAERELPGLLGNLWYPGAEVCTCSHTVRNDGEWAKVTLLMPSGEKVRDIIDYYELRYPDGERKGNDEYLFETERPGDRRPVLVHLFRAKNGTEATRFIARLRV